MVMLIVLCASQTCRLSEVEQVYRIGLGWGDSLFYPTNGSQRRPATFCNVYYATVTAKAWILRDNYFKRHRAVSPEITEQASCQSDVGTRTCRTRRTTQSSLHIEMWWADSCPIISRLFRIEKDRPICVFDVDARKEVGPSPVGSVAQELRVWSVHSIDAALTLALSHQCTEFFRQNRETPGRTIINENICKGASEPSKIF